MPARLAEPPDWPGESVTVRGCDSAVPAPLDWLLPDWVSVAAGLPTTIHPPCVCIAVPSAPVTLKWQKPGVLPALTVTVAGCDGVMVGLVRTSEPLHAGAPS